MQNKNRVYRAFKELQDVGQDILLPTPPLKSGEDLRQVPNHNHDVIDSAKLSAQVEMSPKFEDFRKVQKPFKKMVKKPLSSKDSLVNNDDPIIMGGEDQSDTEARKRRDKVKEVNKHENKSRFFLNS